MATPGGIRVELHTDGRAIVLERTTDPDQARGMLVRHFEAYRTSDTIGYLVALSEKNGQVLGRKRLRGRPS